MIVRAPFVTLTRYPMRICVRFCLGSITTGGRSHATMFGSTDVKHFVIERGSNWVSGGCVGRSGRCGTAGVAKGMRHLPAENPVWTLATQENFAVKNIPGSADGNMSDYEAVYTTEGVVTGDASGSIRARANTALDCLNATAGNAGVDVNVREGLVMCGWEPESAVEWAVDWYAPRIKRNPKRENDIHRFIGSLIICCLLTN